MSRRPLTFSNRMGFPSARGLMKGKTHNLKFPGGISNPRKDKENCFYKGVQITYRRKNQTSFGLIFSVMKFNNSEEVF